MIIINIVEQNFKKSCCTRKRSQAGHIQSIQTKAIETWERVQSKYMKIFIYSSSLLATHLLHNLSHHVPNVMLHLHCMLGIYHGRIFKPNKKIISTPLPIDHFTYREHVAEVPLRNADAVAIRPLWSTQTTLVSVQMSRMPTRALFKIFDADFFSKHEKHFYISEERVYG